LPPSVLTLPLLASVLPLPVLTLSALAASILLLRLRLRGGIAAFRFGPWRLPRRRGPGLGFGLLRLRGWRGGFGGHILLRHRRIGGLAR
jgi:hypothetical protein